MSVFDSRIYFTVLIVSTITIGNTAARFTTFPATPTTGSKSTQRKLTNNMPPRIRQQIRAPTPRLHEQVGRRSRKEAENGEAANPTTNGVM